MILSDEQMAAVLHGTPDSPSYEWVDLPVGPQPLPHWAKGLKISWNDGYMNAPSYTLTTPTHKDFDMRSWPGKVYHNYGTRYLAESGDGRAMCYYHSGPLTLRPLRYRHSCLPVLSAPPRQPNGKLLQHWYWPTQFWYEEVLCWATPQDSGFGGDNIGIRLADGRPAVLRGPWHGPAPDGYVDCGSTGSGAILISEDVLVLLIAKHYSHCRVARVTTRGRSHIQAVREDWDEPKAWMDAKRRRG